MLDLSAVVASILSTLAIGLLAWVGANLTPSRRLRRSLARDAALLAHIPAGPPRSRLEVLVERDADAYGRLRATGGPNGRLVGLSISAAAVIVGATVSAASAILLTDEPSGSLLVSLAWYTLALGASVYFIVDARRDAARVREARLAAVDGEATRRCVRSRAPIGARAQR